MDTIYNVPDVKECNCCNIIKPAEDFSLNKYCTKNNIVIRIKSYCKSCVNTRTNEKRKNIYRYEKYTPEIYQRRKESLNRAKKKYYEKKKLLSKQKTI